jgi:predicted TIM-barrel fold metal-dependent hydrolase
MAIAGVDCHAHVIEPQRFPYADGPGYMPRPDETGDWESFRRVLASGGVSHGLLVQPSCYGTDNACMLDAMARGRGRLKGIAVIVPQATDGELLSLKERGVVGIRLHLMRSDPTALTRPETRGFLARVTALGWFVEVYATGDLWVAVAPILRQSGVRALIAHLGEPDPSRDLGQPGFQAVLALGRETDAVMKLSAPFRSTARGAPYRDVDRFAEAVVDGFGLDRCVWGSDWPFLNTPERVGYGDLLDCLARWLPDPDHRDRVLRRNPARLFGFADEV